MRGDRKAVALRKESVDRNLGGQHSKQVVQNVALRKESVDRNISGSMMVQGALVALRKESVDRNAQAATNERAYLLVALRKESVDRNLAQYADMLQSPRRSPQGERG